ncbi:MAG: amidohydrolase family protein [Proteobacteria bacterium]|nr:amidohydrolase family protein [Pseudomonadota bacterium]
MSKTLIRNGHVVGQTTATCDVLIEDGRIVAVGPALAAGNAQIIEAAGMLVAPGFVDTHRHLWQTSIRGVAADWSLVDYIRNIRLGYATAYTPEDVYIATYVGALEAIDAGITSLGDFCHIIRSPEHAEAARQALIDSGLRARLYYGFYNIPDEKPVFADHAARLAHARDFRRAFGTSTDLISMGVALTEFNLQPIERTTAEVHLARDLDLDITMHMGTLSTPDGVSRLREAGLLGPRMLHVHCNASTDAELAQIAGSGGKVSITPETEMQMGMGFPITNRALKAELRPTFGIDIVSDCSGDMFAQMRLALQTARAIDNQVVLDTGKMPVSIGLTVANAYRFATLDGAAAMGFDGLVGAIAPGLRADIILMKIEGVHHLPKTPDPIATIVLQARPGDVDTVLVDGVVRKRAGKLVNVDFAAIGCRAQTSADHLAEAARDAAAHTGATATASVYAAGVAKMTGTN